MDDYIYIVYFIQSYGILPQIDYMLRLSRLFLRTLRKSVPISMDNSVSLQDRKGATMEPYLDRCYNQTNTAAMCNIPFNATPGNSIYRQSHGYNTAYNVRSNVCTTAANCLPGNQVLDKERYKTIRKWKKFGKGKDHYLCLPDTKRNNGV